MSGANVAALTDLDKECIREYAENNMCYSKASRVLYMHPNTLRYRLERIHKATGLNPFVFYDLVELLDILGEEETWKKSS